jgi:uncharacterized protein YndB with AHSA1/START domain
VSTPTGQTEDAGFEIGVSRTIPVPLEQVWDFLVSREGVALWLGQDVELPTEKGTRYTTADGTTGDLRSFHKQNRIRITWRPQEWDHDTTVQVTVSDNGGKTLLRFHQEWLADTAERSRQRDHWKAIMESVVAALENN